MSSSEDIKKLKKQLDKQTDPAAMLATLNTLAKCEISVEILKETRIGKAVGKLRKHENKQVAQACAELVNKWKQHIGADSTGTSSSQTSQSTTPPTTPTPTTTEPTTPTPSDGSNENSNSNNNNNSNSETEQKKRKSEKEEEEDSKSNKKSKQGGSDEEESSPSSAKNSSSSSSKKSSSSSSSKSADRERVVDLLREALGQPLEGDLDPHEVASQIEEELFVTYKGVTREYKTKFRSLSFNLKNPKNPVLRQQVLAGNITAQRLCTMSAQDMAHDELKKERQRMAEYQMEASKIVQFNATSTDMFKCGKCGKRETTYYQMQTRSADEPMTTFHTCINCGARWKS